MTRMCGRCSTYHNFDDCPYSTYSNSGGGKNGAAMPPQRLNQFPSSPGSGLAQCFHYDRDPVWKLHPGYSSNNPTGTRQVCGTCKEPLAPTLTQRQREDAVLVEQTLQEVSQKILDHKPMYMTRNRWPRMTGPEIYRNAQEIMSRVVYWPYP